VRALLAVAHGSRDPRHAAALHGLLGAVRRAEPDLCAELAFLDLCGPDARTALARLAASGAEEITVVPLFLSRGYHVGHDVPAVAEHARDGLARPPRLAIAAHLGPDPLLRQALDRRLRERGVDPCAPGLGLVLASATTASTAAAIGAARARGASDLAVASYFLAPGLLYDRVRADALAARVPVSAPFTTPEDEPPAELVRLVLARHAAADTRTGRAPVGARPVSAAAA
jgi:sirohydrochlorin ferrochelatase